MGTVETMVGSLKVSAKDMSTVETMVGSLKVSAKDISTVETMVESLGFNWIKALSRQWTHQ